MHCNETRSLIFLSMIPKVGPVTIGRIVEEFQSAYAFHQLSEKERNTVLKQKPNWSAIEKQVDKELAFVNKHKVSVLHPRLDNYPDLLKECSDKPYILYYKGLESWLQRPKLAFVGTRHPSNEGKRKVQMLIEGLAQYNPVIISGLAAGIDTYAHEVALENNLETIAVLGNSLNRIYPAHNKKLAKDIISQGCLLTEFYSTAGVEKVNFVRRNRIIAGLSIASVIVESKSKGGALLTADFAHGYNRDVFAVPGCLFNENTEGCNNLIKANKAIMVTEADDIVQALNWDLVESKPEPQQQVLDFGLPDDEQKIVRYITEKSKVHIDELKISLGFDIGTLSTLLLNLEMSNIIRSYPGNLYALQ